MKVQSDLSLEKKHRQSDWKIGMNKEKTKKRSNGSWSFEWNSRDTPRPESYMQDMGVHMVEG